MGPPIPLTMSLSKGGLLIWFDKLTMSGYKGSGWDPTPLTLSLSKGGLLIWFDKLTMSGYKGSGWNPLYRSP